MRTIFAYFSEEERRDAFIDRTVLLTGIVLMALTVAQAAAAKANTRTGDAVDRAALVEGWLPS